MDDKSSAPKKFQERFIFVKVVGKNQQSFVCGCLKK